MADKIVQLVTPTMPAPKDCKGIATWMRDWADQIEKGEYPHLERVLITLYEPGNPEGCFYSFSSGLRDINRTEHIGLMQLAMEKEKGRIKL